MQQNLILKKHHTSKFAKKADLVSLKSDVNGTVIDKLKTASTDLSKLSIL